MAGYSTVHTDLRMMPPGPRGYEIIAVIRDIWRDPLRCFVNAPRRYGDIVYTRFGRHWFLISHPDQLKHVLQENGRNYHRGSNVEPLKSLTGEGLLANDGAYWLRQRRLVQPAFHHTRIQAMATTITDCTAAMLHQWKPSAEYRRPLEIEAEMHRLTVHIIGRVLFSLDLSAQSDTVSRALTICLKQITRRVQSFGFPPETWPTPGNRRFHQARRTLDAVVESMIAERRHFRTDTGDLLSMLLLVRDKSTNQGMTDQQLRDEVMSLLVAGFETTANGLCWLWYLLSIHPHIMQRLRAELATLLGGRTPTAQDLPELVYTRMVIEETLRLYPPSWLTARTSLQNDEIGGYRIPAGAIILLGAYITHRHPAIWENPEGFDPERFAAGLSATRHRYAYIPFGGGAHLCIGNTLAMMMMQLIVAMVAQAYQLDLVPGHPVMPQPLITLRPKYGLLMTCAGGGTK